MVVCLGGASTAGVGRIPEPVPAEDSQAWEPEDLDRADAGARQAVAPTTVAQDLCLRLIGWYQRGIARHSVSRCPFAISCSNYAAQAIARHGCLRGLCLFIDRNLYRENPQIPSHYRLTELPGGILKFDDGFFLEGRP